jgi:hypothetical protein
MKKYTLTITARKEDCVTIHTYETIESNDFTELCARIPLVIAKIMKEELFEQKEEILKEMDDIPF